MSLIILSIPIFFLLIGIEVLADRIWYKRLYRLADATTNLSCGITEQVSGVFAKTLTMAGYVWLYEHARIADIPQTWYWALLLLIGIDFCYYWAHRMSHEINLFWAGHVVHHQSEDYNLSVALRQGMFQKFFTAIFYLPLAICGFEPTWMLGIMAIDTLYQFWIHTETIGKMGILEWVLNTPSHHRVHHGRNPQYIDKNHAGIFIIWDRIFGTFEEENEKPIYGITTPLTTYNPVYAQVAHFDHIWHDLRQISGWGNKLQYLWRKPGWYPAAQGGYQAPPAINRDSYQKFQVALSPAQNRYLLLQYLLLLGGVAAFLFTMQHLSQPMQVVIAVFIFFSTAVLGLLFNGYRYAKWLEISRLALTVALLVWLAQIFL